MAVDTSCVMAPARDVTFKDPALMSPKLTPPLVDRIVRLPPTSSVPPLCSKPAVLKLPLVESFPAVSTSVPLLVRVLKVVAPGTPLS
jgi:hypothetical protein